MAFADDLQFLRVAAEDYFVFRVRNVKEFTNSLTNFQRTI